MSTDKGDLAPCLTKQRSKEETTVRRRIQTRTVNIRIVLMCVRFSIMEEQISVGSQVSERPKLHRIQDSDYVTYCPELVSDIQYWKLTYLQYNMNSKEKAQEVEAEDWIKFYREQMMNDRNLYYEKLGLVREEPPRSSLQVEKHFESGDYSLNFFVAKSNDDIRNSYLDKLISTGVLKLEPSKKFQCIVIFDWDDTIMSTSFISGFDSLKAVTPEARVQLNNLDACASKLIQKAASYGDLFIVTNAAKGWVQYSSKQYILADPALQKAKTVIISARTTFEIEFPGDFHRWKTEAFKNIKKKFQTHLITNLICVGDSNIQIDAAHILGKEFNQSLVKTIKFRENPKPEQLVKQQELVTEKLEQIYSNSKNLTIKLEKKQSITKKQKKEEKPSSKISNSSETSSTSQPRHSQTNDRDSITRKDSKDIEGAKESKTPKQPEDGKEPRMKSTSDQQ